MPEVQPVEVAHDARRLERLRRGRGSVRQPVARNRASELGHPCERYLVWIRPRWAEAQPLSDELLKVFEAGEIFHDIARAQLRKDGYTVTQDETPLARYQGISGTLDCRVDGILSDIKSMSQNNFRRFKTLDDFLSPSIPYYWRKVVTQVEVYALQAGDEKAQIVPFSKQNLDYRFITVPLIMERADAILEKSARIDALVVANESPPPTYGRQCSDCCFNHICPPEPVEGVQMRVDLEDDLGQWWALRGAAGQFAQIDKRLSEASRGHPLTLSASFRITGTWGVRNYPAKPASSIQTWTKKIEPLNPDFTAEAEAED